MRIREMEPRDAESVYRFWEKYYVATDRETPERIVVVLEKNPGLSSVAENEVSGEFEAVVLVTSDGRIGRIYKLVVRNDLQGNGLGGAMLARSVEKLFEEGLLDIRIDCGEELVDFYKKCGFEIKEDNHIHMQIKKY